MAMAVAPGTKSSSGNVTNAYVFNIEVAGLSPSEIQVVLEDDKALVISGNGKLLSKFVTADDANTDAISAVSNNGVLTVTVKKLMWGGIGPKKTKIVEVKTV